MLTRLLFHADPIGIFGDLPGVYFRADDPAAAPAATIPAGNAGEPQQDNQANAWRRKFEDAERERRRLADEAQARKAGEMSDIEKEKARADAAEATARDAGAKLLKLQVATEAGVPADALDLLTAADEAGLRAQAAAVVKLAGASATVARQAGTVTNPAASQQPSIDEQIASAQRAGNNQEAIRLKRHKAFGT